jgi:hypothetical protein
MTNEQLYFLLKTIHNGLENILAGLPETAERITIHNKRVKPEYRNHLILLPSEDMLEEYEEDFDPDKLTRLYDYAENMGKNIETLVKHD